MVNSPPANSRPPKPIRARRSTDKNYVNQDVVDEHNRKTRNSSTDSNETIGTPTSNIRVTTFLRILWKKNIRIYINGTEKRNYKKD